MSLVVLFYKYDIKLLDSGSRNILNQDKLHFLTLKNRMLSHAIIQLERFEPYQLKIVNNKYGKPYLKDIKNLSFNFSNTKDCIILAAAMDIGEIGADVEYLKPRNFKNYTTFFTDNENEEFLKKGTLNDFYRLWVLKESYTKALGKGLNIPLKSFEVSTKKDEITFINLKTGDKLYGKTFSFGRKYICGVCNKNKQALNNLRLINFSQLIES